MRTSSWLVLAIIVLTIVALACNSNETLLTPQSPQSASKAATPAQPPADDARRITAEELHKLWEKNQVTIIDTRGEPSYKQEHIRGAILVPPGTVLSKLDQLPRDKIIVAYCT